VTLGLAANRAKMLARERASASKRPALRPRCMTDATEPAWVAPLREATRAPAMIAREDLEVMRGSRPSLFDSDGALAISSALLAAFVVAAAIFRERVGGAGQLDLIALLLRVAGAAFVLRAALAVRQFVRRLSRDARAFEHSLAFGSQGLFMRTPTSEHWASKEEVLGIVLPEQPSRGPTPPAPGPLWLVLRPGTAPRELALPPYFAGSQEILAARLTRWLGREAGEPQKRFDYPKPGPEQRYARIASGSLEAGEVRVPEGLSYRARAPYGAILGCVFALDAVRGAGPMAAQLWPGVLAACALALAFLIGWFVWMGGRRKSRLGIAMALTREEMLLRGKAGVVGIPWGQLAQVEVDVRLTWSPFLGSYPVRVLALSTTDGERVLFDGGFLGIAPECLAVLCESYRRRQL
jgi:hypothetical protein